MKLFRNIIVSCIGITTMTAAAQNLPARHQKEVVKNGFYVSSSEYNYSALATDITADATTKYEQARLIYLWICNNISFDQTGEIRTADRTYDNRRAVCQGFCELYYRLADALKLEVNLIYGKAKIPLNNGIEEHVWLGIKTEKGTILADPTWGAGKIRNGSFGRIPDPLVWFDVDPSIFINTHFPKNKKQQFITPTIKEEKFMELPYVTP